METISQYQWRHSCGRDEGKGFDIQRQKRGLKERRKVEGACRFLKKKKKQPLFYRFRISQGFIFFHPACIEQDTIQLFLRICHTEVTQKVSQNLYKYLIYFSIMLRLRMSGLPASNIGTGSLFTGTNIAKMLHDDPPIQMQMQTNGYC